LSFAREPFTQSAFSISCGIFSQKVIQQRCRLGQAL
jgi:hypothetical protein